jgi:protein TonB
MVNTKLVNIVSLVFAILLYFIVLVLVIKIYQGDIKDLKKFGFDEEKSIVVNLDDILINSKVTQKKTTKQKDIKKPKIIKVSSNTEKKSKSDSRDLVEKSVKDLFSTMKVKKNANEIEEKLKQEKTRASRLKKIKAKELFKSSSINKKEITKELMKIKKMLKDTKDKVKGDYDDKFWSKVSSIIMTKWNQTVGTKDGLKATVIIKIDYKGRLFYRNLKFSFNNLFDTKLKQFLDSLSKEKFPPYKKGRYIEAEFVFADKEEI